MGWKGSIIFPSREGEIQLKDLEKILLGELCLLQLQMQCSSASCCFPVGSVYVCVSVCQRLWGEGPGYKIKVLSYQELRTLKRSESNNLLHFNGNKCRCSFSLWLRSSDWIDDNVMFDVEYYHIIQTHTKETSLQDKNILYENYEMILECESFLGSQAL